MNPSTLSPRHYLLVAHAGWGHLRPLVALASSMLTLANDLHITMLLVGRMALKADTELERYGLTTEQKSRFRRIRYSPGPMQGDGLLAAGEGLSLVATAIENFSKTYPLILSSSPLTDILSPHPVSLPAGLKRPSLLILDMNVVPVCAPMAIQMEKALGLEPSIKLSFIPLSSAAAASVLFPTAFQTNSKKAWEEIQGGRDQAKAATEFLAANDEMLICPDIEPIHLYELTPTGDPPLIQIMYGAIEGHKSLDGCITGWPGEMSTQTLAESPYHLKHWFTVGPLLPPDNGIAGGNAKEHTMAGFGDEVTVFLDEMAVNYGDRSVLYISFGTFLYPPNDSQIKILMEVLIKCKIPFLIAQGLATAQMVEHIREAVSKSDGRGMLAPWVRQMAVLGHRAMSFFLTHCGSNSVLESLSAGIPMICWPGNADQPIIANELSRRHHVAWELYQVRRGPAIGRKTSTGVLVEGTEIAVKAEMMEVFRRMQSGEGEGLRKRARGMSQMMRETRREGGMAFEAKKKLAHLSGSKGFE